MTAVKLGVTYNRDVAVDRVAISTAPNGTTFVDEKKNVWRRDHDVQGGFTQTVGPKSVIPPTYLKVIAVPVPTTAA